ncbi:hypothetical protein IE81DRAFT_68072 [Ceraceosorus guamensis]|uniref:Uncharacterized protein n=1 Tax=Ceraceosorus guamensis TaxID=1522189 RepID=A0A316W3Q8_9BASI|nr:hypothetical protein IE81DRAFT_68072 [Ceraceosorus guamensis]PWN43758.1 hypothetical protein IE81DRAFT_68072 [Ceraceosorus guamensis]
MSSSLNSKLSLLPSSPQSPSYAPHSGDNNNNKVLITRRRRSGRSRSSTLTPLPSATSITHSAASGDEADIQPGRKNGIFRNFSPTYPRGVERSASAVSNELESSSQPYRSTDEPILAARRKTITRRSRRRAESSSSNQSQNSGIVGLTCEGIKLDNSSQGALASDPSSAPKSRYSLRHGHSSSSLKTSVADTSSPGARTPTAAAGASSRAKRKRLGTQASSRLEEVEQRLKAQEALINGTDASTESHYSANIDPQLTQGSQGEPLQMLATPYNSRHPLPLSPHLLTSRHSRFPRALKSLSGRARVGRIICQSCLQGSKSGCDAPATSDEPCTSCNVMGGQCVKMEVRYGSGNAPMIVPASLETGTTLAHSTMPKQHVSFELAVGDGVQEGWPDGDLDGTALAGIPALSGANGNVSAKIKGLTALPQSTSFAAGTNGLEASRLAAEDVKFTSWGIPSRISHKGQLVEISCRRLVHALLRKFRSETNGPHALIVPPSQSDLILRRGPGLPAPVPDFLLLTILASSVAIVTEPLELVALRPHIWKKAAAEVEAVCSSLYSLKGDLALIQALLLLAVYWPGDPGRIERRHVISTALRLAPSCGLHNPALLRSNALVGTLALALDAITTLWSASSDSPVAETSPVSLPMPDPSWVYVMVGETSVPAARLLAHLMCAFLSLLQILKHLLRNLHQPVTSQFTSLESVTAHQNNIEGALSAFCRAQKPIILDAEKQQRSHPSAAVLAKSIRRLLMIIQLLLFKSSLDFIVRRAREEGSHKSNEARSGPSAAAEPVRVRFPPECGRAVAAVIETAWGLIFGDEERISAKGCVWASQLDPSACTQMSFQAFGVVLGARSFAFLAMHWIDWDKGKGCLEYSTRPAPGTAKVRNKSTTVVSTSLLHPDERESPIEHEQHLSMPASQPLASAPPPAPGAQTAEAGENGSSDPQSRVVAHVALPLVDPVPSAALDPRLFAPPEDATAQEQQECAIDPNLELSTTVEEASSKLLSDPPLVEQASAEQSESEIIIASVESGAIQTPVTA